MRFLLLTFTLLFPCFPQRVLWVVENIDHVRAACERIGLTGVREYPNIRMHGEFRGQPIVVVGWQISGRLGEVTVDIMQPAEGQANAYTNFLSKHGDGVLAIVYELPNQAALDRQVARMRASGAGVLQRLTVRLDDKDVTYVFLDTERRGKFIIGFALNLPKTSPAHFTVAAHDPAEVSAYWKSLGFPFDARQTREDEGIDGIEIRGHSTSTLIGGIELRTDLRRQPSSLR